MGVRRAGAVRRHHRARLGATILTLVVAPLALAGTAHAAPPISGLSSTAAGDNHTCAVTTTATVKCWGLNRSGQLGDGTTISRRSPQNVPALSSIASVASGSAHSCAVTTGGGVWCWGLNDHGELGNNLSATAAKPPTAVLDTAALPVHTPISGVSQIALGGEFSCLLTTLGRVECWGRNDKGQLGIDFVGESESRFTPYQVVGLTSGVTAIAAGGKHACALMTGATVKCWGLNDHGALGYSTGLLNYSKVPNDVPGLTNVTAIAVGGQHTCALISGGTVKCWGLNASGQIGNHSTSDASSPTVVSGLPAGVTAIATGSQHTCAISGGGALDCWGLNTNGELGDTTTTNRSVATAVPGAATNITAIDLGATHSCLRMTSGLTKCWGGNVSGQLGDGTLVDLYNPFVPDPPTGVTAVGGDRSAHVAWTAPVPDGLHALTFYSVQTIPGGALLQVPATQTSVTVHGLTNGSTYWFKVTARNGIGVSRSSAQSAPVVPAGLPGPPSQISVATADRSATVFWHAAPSNGSALTAYRVSASPGGASTVVSASHGSATLTGLTNGATYTFTVRASNKVGAGPAASVTVRLPIPKSGYWMLGRNGSVYPFGNSQQLGSASFPSWPSGTAAVAIAVRRDGRGYWVVDNAGGVHPFGAAGFFGDHPSLPAGESVSTISATPSSAGYWLFTNRGRAVPYGDAHSYGDMSAAHLNGPVIASVATPTGHGYFMVASDGGVFTFGDAHFHGSTGAIHLNKPVVGLSPTFSNNGYWLVASDGGVFAFGDATFRGSMGGTPLNKAVNGLVRFGSGYLMVASDGGVFNFSDKPFYGSLGSNPPAAPIIGIASFTA
jgi:alpha-tubulin suppressor-like RCC1 family protein